ncbi:uncharacterized protein NECHADRAFT_88976 [Fusarium vanettenii 77-13-4]|uniref:Uncharacterized protein n=1 Tax=Fusarium vanettenii (strain ATCC MYA-4622 / CBS 123669 / FGSC 9596 / NRRL 45880 / 77-13-4) TaxID=660122 RepID=C7ZN19_FUSV7|nr:uncharacterized protein NECHADRAFT_88976 [Fusarium vanettenii 77-13-4]EEU34591.1 predicted protein [Fusarium vanettenii 77-13-4]
MDDAHGNALHSYIGRSKALMINTACLDEKMILSEGTDPRNSSFCLRPSIVVTTTYLVGQRATGPTVRAEYLGTCRILIDLKGLYTASSAARLYLYILLVYEDY